MTDTASRSDPVERARALFLRHHGVLSTADAIREGVHPRTLYRMRDEGVLERLGRGLYRLAELPPLGNYDLVTVALQVPAAVVCLISALAFHDLTTQIPHQVDVALRRGSEPPKIEFPPVRVVWWSGACFAEGVEQHDLDGVTVRVYSPEKSIVDCMRHRNKVGLDVALEALRDYRRRPGARLDEVYRLAQLCRIGSVIRPYLEAVQ